MIVNSTIARYQYVLGLLKSKYSELSDSRHRTENLEGEVAFLTEWSVAIGDKVCKSCNGFGNVRHFLAQDEVETRQCQACKGTGLRDV